MRQGQSPPGARQIRIDLQAPLQKRDRVPVVLGCLAIDRGAAEQEEIVSCEIARPLPLRGLAVGRHYNARVAGELCRDMLRKLGLHGEDIIDGPIPAIRPEMRARLRLDELRSYAETVVLPLDRALEDVTDVKIAADLPDVDCLVLVDLDRVAGHHLDCARKRARSVMMSSVMPSARRPVCSSAAKIVEGQHRDRCAGARRLDRPHPPEAGPYQRRRDEDRSSSQNAPSMLP